MTKFSRNSYTFREGLAMMAAKALGIDPDIAVEAGESATAVMNLIRHAAKLRGQDRDTALRDAKRELRRISHRQHSVLVEALHGKLLEVAGHGRASVNPATGAEEFFWPFDQLKDAASRVSRGIGNVFGIGSARATEPESTEIEPIYIKGTRRNETLIEPITVSARRINDKPILQTGSVAKNNTQTKQPLNDFQTSREMKDFIRFQEGDLEGCKDSIEGGTQTCGVGYKLAPGEKWDPSRKEEMFDKRILEAEDRLRRLVKVPLTQSQHDALVSLAYNTRENPSSSSPGSIGWANSKMLRKLNEGDYGGASREFIDWNKAAGKPQRGLSQRRMEEAYWFSRDDLEKLRGGR